MLPLRALAAPLLCVGLLCGAFLLLLADLLPFPLPYVEPATFLTCVVEVQVFFALFVWPLLLREGADRATLLRAGGLIVGLAVPFVLVAANVSNAAAGQVIRGQALVAAFVLLGAGIQAPGRGRSAGLQYALLMVALSTVPPFWAFLASEFAGRDYSAFAVASPFWAAGLGVGVAAPLLAAGAAIAGGVLLLRGRRVPAKVDGPPAPQ